MRADLPYHLRLRHFTGALMLALAVHAAIFAAWSLRERDPVVIVPVRVLKLKLGGDAADPGAGWEVAETAENEAPVEHSLASLFSPPAPAAVAEKKVVPRQFVRAPQPQVQPRPAEKKPAGAPAGETEAEILARYEQAISGWIQRFKVYPEEAREAGMTGDIILRIRINRRGTIRYSALETSTGHEALDRAALEMIKRANPVPAVPKNYPAGEIIEFLIPVSFRLQ